MPNPGRNGELRGEFDRPEFDRGSGDILPEFEQLMGGGIGWWRGTMCEDRRERSTKLN